MNTENRQLTHLHQMISGSIYYVATPQLALNYLNLPPHTIYILSLLPCHTHLVTEKLYTPVTIHGFINEGF